MDGGKRAAARALAMVGARFRLGGRNPDLGIDCIGVVLASHGRAPPRSMPRRATFGATADAPWDICLAEIGLAPLPADTRGLDGDVLLLDCGRGRRHLAIRAGNLFVHAHAGLGRVVAVPVLEAMTVLSCWRRASLHQDEGAC